jgi:hypothetical protein
MKARARRVFGEDAAIAQFAGALSAFPRDRPQRESVGRSATRPFRASARAHAIG